MMDWRDEKCWDCVFASGFTEADAQCRRFPPAMLRYSDDAHATYPKIERWTNACAEFQHALKPLIVPEGFDARPGAINRIVKK